MSFKSFIGKIFAKIVYKRIQKASLNAIEEQQKVFQNLVSSAKLTQFGKDHNFSGITSYEDFKKQVPIRDYEGLKDYVEEIKKGKENILWPGLPIYFCKTSGTTSGVKYIPISKESIGYHISGARNAILSYMAETGKSDFVDGKMIFLQGSPELDNSGKIPLGRLSGIVAHHVPGYLQKNRMPSYEVNCIEDWEEKVNAIADETLSKKMTLISGIPPWVQMYFDVLLEKADKKTIQEIFPHFSLFIYGGVNFEPYRKKFEETIGKKVDSIEVYPASEGFIAYQDSQKQEGLMLIPDGGIFYEFIPANEFFDENPTRISLKDVELNTNYVIILNTNAGLWGYNIGDTVKFVSKKPYRIVVTGRIKHFTSAFGEHVIAEEVDAVMKLAAEKFGLKVKEFHVAPQVNPEGEELPYHEWFIEFSEQPNELEKIALYLDEQLQQKNTYYKDLITGNILQPLKIKPLSKNAFQSYMKSIGKLGGQNKVPRLANDRVIADKLL